MKQTWRWFGPHDVVSIDEIVQAGATGVVSALHHIPAGEAWAGREIAKRQGEIARRADGSASGLAWDVVESLPVAEEIKIQSGDWRRCIENYLTSLENIASAGIAVVCYNFMPVLDWTRTQLSYELPTGARCMRFDFIDFAAFDICILERDGADRDFPEDVVEQARARHAGMSDAARQHLLHAIVAGLPGANQSLSMTQLRELLAAYRDIDRDAMIKHHHDFLAEVAPTAERLGLRLCCHPDDPPFPLLGLPRIASTEADYARIVAAAPSPANGVALCSGSLGVNPENDLPGMMRRLGAHVHFLHLRNVRREEQRFPGAFHEAAHLEGDTDMVALLKAVLEEETRRKAQGRADWSIPMRPDHGHEIADDRNRSPQPGYPLIGRLRGLAELRGVAIGLGGDVQ
ncbi:MAG: mannonate dehydratase [Neomegalonema sp.]|nr:mannonate dehydratase [Neomegalonema sp.]